MESNRQGEHGHNEGEGSRSADRQYREGVQRFLQENDPERLARQAERDVARDPESYRRAEEEGRSRSAGEDPQPEAPDPEEIKEPGQDRVPEVREPGRQRTPRRE